MIVKFLEILCQRGKEPEEIITDNHKEFVIEISFVLILT